MTKQLCRIALVGALGISMVSLEQAASAQGIQPSCLTCIGQASPADLNAQREITAVRETAASREVIPLQLQVVISKFQGEKKISSLPYTLSFNTGTNPQAPGGSIRMGTQIAIPTSNTVEGKTTTSYNYRDIGTSIDCGASARPDGAFNVYVTVSDSAVYPDDQRISTGNPMPVIRSYQTTNRLILKDGQTSQFTAATDRLSGEVVKIDVTLKMLK